MLLRSVIIIGVVFQYSISIWQAIDKYFVDQFIKYHNLRNDSSEVVKNNVTISQNLSISIIESKGGFSKANRQPNVCFKPSFTEIFLNFCPKVDIIA